MIFTGDAILFIYLLNSNGFHDISHKIIVLSSSNYIRNAV